MDRLPALDRLERFYWRCFNELNRSRQSGWSINPLSPSDVYFWCLLNGVQEQNEQTLVWQTVGDLDARLLKYAREKSKEAKDDADTGSGN